MNSTEQTIVNRMAGGFSLIDVGNLCFLVWPEGDGTLGNERVDAFAVGRLVIGLYIEALAGDAAGVGVTVFRLTDQGAAVADQAARAAGE